MGEKKAKKKEKKRGNMKILLQFGEKAVMNL